jgi:3-keto-5-aminohexanoate cleavage enzyme
MSLQDKCVISAALAGAVTNKGQNPSVPYGIDECIEESVKAYESGAAVVHIHARTPQGMPTEDPAIIGPIVEGIRARCPILINLSTAVGVGKTADQRIGVVINHKPDLASLNTGSMNFGLADWKNGMVIGEIVFENTFAMIERFNKEMKKAGTKPELEIYDIGHVCNVQLLKISKMFQEPLHFQFVFGVAGGIILTPHTFALMHSMIPADSTWSVCGVGPNSFRGAFMAAVNGGHIRVGLEDNIYIEGKTLAKGSWELVEKAVKIANLAGREIATPEEARILWNLPAKA